MPKDGRSDILTTYHFYIEVQGDSWGSFRECSGLVHEQEVIPHIQSGKDGKLIIHKVPGAPKAGELTLKRALTDDMRFWAWRKEIDEGKVVSGRKNGAVVMYDQENGEIARWAFTAAWPSKITGPALNANSNEVAVEEVTLTYESLARSK